jgi:KaiC/GvpD/RAD55 family RecA-like ATPase
MMERVKTGIAGLDEALGGGYPAGSIVSLVGGSGCGKSTFAMQFLQRGITENKESGLYISFEEEKQRYFDYMKNYGWDLAEMERSRKFTFLEYPPQEVDHFLSQELMIHDMIDEMKITRVVIDSITSFAVMYDTPYRKKQETVKLLSKLKKWGCTIMLTAESSVDSEGNPHARFSIEPLSDGVIYLYNIRKGEQRQRALEVIKMRGTSYEGRMFPMRFTANGVEIYPNERVF